MDTLSRYPQENGPSYEHLVDQEGNVDLDCYNLFSFHSVHARALQVDDFATSTSVSAAENAASVYELATEQVSLEDLTQAHDEGYGSFMLSDTVELVVFVAAYRYGWSVVFE